MYAGQVVESGPAVEVTDSPAHPYTQLLLSAAPDPDRPAPGGTADSAGRDGAGALPAVRGAPPSLVAPPPGCRFHPRCPHAMAICAETAPASFETTAGHLSACWLHATDLDAAQAAPLPPATPLRPEETDRQTAPTP